MSQTATIAASQLTLEEWAALPDDELGEFVDGVLIEEEIPDFVHELAVGILIRLLGVWAAPRGGVVAASGAKFAVAPGIGRKPDVTVFFSGRPLPLPRGVIRTPPDIAIEVVSPRPRDGLRDRVDKVAEYAGFGVRYYWLIDLELRSLEILELGAGGRYIHALGCSSGVLLNVPGCPDMTLDLDSFWAESDRIS